jgi:hypothetical protein
VRWRNFLFIPVVNYFLLEYVEKSAKGIIRRELNHPRTEIEIEERTVLVNLY